MLVLFLILFVCVRGYAIYTGKATCPDDQDCNWIHSYFATQNFKCVNNDQCPKGFLCCSDCHYHHRICKSALWISEKENPNMMCPKTTTFCKKKFPYMGTKSFKCTSNEECDPGFLCCTDHCYEHKICKEAVEEDNCPKDLKICLHPLSYEKTKKYKCDGHSQCRKESLCCFDSCYTHKICKPKPDLFSSDKKCPISIRRESCLNTNLTLLKYACKTIEDCIFGYICCEDNCYNHKVCKLPNGAFSYQKVYEQQDFKKSSFEEHKCPTVKDKCTKPYSLRLARKFICFNDKDCKFGQLCCKDSCVKDFKICKSILTLKPEEVTTVKELVLQIVQPQTNWSNATNETILAPLKAKIPTQSLNLNNDNLTMKTISTTETVFKTQTIVSKTSKTEQETTTIGYSKSVIASTEKCIAPTCKKKRKRKRSKAFSKVTETENKRMVACFLSELSTIPTFDESTLYASKQFSNKIKKLKEAVTKNESFL